MKKKPTGFVAQCQCGETIGALDYERTDRVETGKILGQWLAQGCSIHPKFESNWSAHVSSCKCSDE